MKKQLWIKYYLNDRKQSQRRGFELEGGNKWNSPKDPRTSLLLTIVVNDQPDGVSLTCQCSQTA